MIVKTTLEDKKAAIYKISQEKLLQVGSPRPKIFEELERPTYYPNLTYPEVTAGKENWVNKNYFIPKKFDLVELLAGTKIYKGWWSGHKWDGLRIKGNELITHWRRE